MAQTGWQLEMGAQVIAGGRVRFRVWAPAARSIEVELYPPPEGIVRHAMAPEEGGSWSAEVEVAAGTLYRYHLNEWGYPDPYSRSQPEGVHGPSQVIDPSAFEWSDAAWRGLDPEALVTYECHVGVYTPEGTFDALVPHLEGLRTLGVTALELMPVAEFPGRRNWGYDGVNLFAPSSIYGGPEGLRRLVNAAHAAGIGVILDVVYNHLGPDGNYLRVYSPDYFTDRYQTPWGDAINFDGPNSAVVRRLFIDNALHWLHEYHIDGLRLDATHTIYDSGQKHILQELVEAVREHGPVERGALIVAEDERNETRLVLPRDEGGFGLDALWVDDFHHSVHVLLTGEEEGYLGSYEGTAEEIARLLRVGFLYQSPPKKPGEPPAGVAPALPAHRLVYSLQNHDQVGNLPFGRRLSDLIDLERYKAALALLLLSPCTPLLFMGDEFAASAPFYYFTDHEYELGEQVLAGRLAEFKDFWATRPADLAPVPNPQDEQAFVDSRLDHSERAQPPHDGVYRLTRELLRLRREDAVLRAQDRWRLLAAALAPELVGIERWDAEGERRLLLVNFGQQASFDVASQAWLGDAATLTWRPLLSTSEARFAGPGAPLEGLTLQPDAAIALPARCATLWAVGG
ncbi:MAG: malto-oligosyltrehalose trehalohydrolase [Dehalococcoidia bacterium]